MGFGTFTGFNGVVVSRQLSCSIVVMFDSLSFKSVVCSRSAFGVRLINGLAESLHRFSRLLHVGRMAGDCWFLLITNSRDMYLCFQKFTGVFTLAFKALEKLAVILDS